MKAELLLKLKELGLSDEQILKIADEPEQETETKDKESKEESKETETEQDESKLDTFNESVNSMFKNFDEKLTEMTNKLNSFNQRFGEISNAKMAQRTTDDILAEILMPNGESLKGKDK